VLNIIREINETVTALPSKTAEAAAVVYEFGGKFSVASDAVINFGMFVNTVMEDITKKARLFKMKGFQDNIDSVFKAVKKAARQLKTDLTKIFTNMWDLLLVHTHKAIGAIRKDTREASRALASIARMARSASSAKGEAAEAKKEGAGADVRTSRTFRSNVSGDENLFQAIHRPEWYYGETGYRMHAISMDASLAAISGHLSNMDVAPAAGTASGRRAEEVGRLMGRGS